MKLKKEDRVIFIVMLGFILFVLAATQVYADSYRHYYPAPVAGDITNITNINYCAPVALAGASGSHNYKATPNVQWSITGAYLSGKCDDSAFSFGAGWQLGNVFTAVNFSTNGVEDNMVVFSASGEF